MNLRFQVTIAEGKHPFPYRTRQLSPPAPMVLVGQLTGRVGRRLVMISKPSPREVERAFFLS